MGEVLEFQPRKLSEGPPERLATPAEIFIFPGARIERRGFSLADRLYSATKSHPKSRQSRKKSKE